MYDTTHSYVRHDSCICVLLLVYCRHVCLCARDMTQSYVCHDAFICVTWLIHMCDMTPSHVWRDAFICATWLIHVCGMRHSYMWLDPFLCVTWLIHILDLMYFLRMEWRIQMCSMTHTWKDLAHVIFLIHICDRTHFYAYHGCMWVFCACVWYESI